MLPKDIELLNLKDINCDDELPETGNTFRANALQKARYVHEKFGMNCFADDSGLEVLALGGRPGVYSARYAGNNARSEDNISKLLHELKDVTDRRARFKTVICLYLNDDVHYFEGEVSGSISTETSGESGFGYDPVFVPDGYSKTFSEMTEAEKNAISHRRKAVDELVAFLWNQ